MSVLLVALLALMAAPFGSAEAQNPPGTIADIAVADPGNFSILVSALDAAGLVPTVADPAADLTVFAPTNAAFIALGQATIDSLFADPTGDLADILLYHVLGSSQDSTSLLAAGSATTAQGDDVSITTDGTNAFVNNAVITVVDIPASNGIIHVIDAVLTPPAPPLPTIADIAVGDPANFSTLVTALDAAGLVPTVADPAADLTVFAPTNAAFAALEAASPGIIDALLADPTGDLTDILLYHVLGSSQDAATLLAAGSVTTLQGDTISITQNGDVFINDAMVTSANIPASNGIVHVIDAVLTPPADESVLVDGQKINVVSAESGRYLDGDRGWWRTNVDTSSKARLDDQWILEATGNGTWRLLNAKHHLYLDADNRYRHYNVDLGYQHYTGTEWEITELNNGNYMLRTVAYDRYLDYDRRNVDTSTHPGTDTEWQINVVAGH